MGVSTQYNNAVSYASGDIQPVSTEFDAGVSQSQWTISIFILALGLGQLPFGYLSDQLGRRPVALIGLMLFMCGSALG